MVAFFAGFTGVILLLVAIGELWNQNPAMLLGPIESLLKPKDRANFTLVSSQLAALGWPFTVAVLVSGLLWISLARCLWSQRLLAAAPRLVVIGALLSFVGHGLVMPKLAEAKSYRAFMLQVNQLVGREDQLYLYRTSFNSDQVVFYRGEPVAMLSSGPDNRLDSDRGDTYVIMTERDWLDLQKLNASLPPPLVKSAGKGPEGDARIVLVRLQASDQPAFRLPSSIPY
jgi:hypothetical protein